MIRTVNTEDIVKNIKEMCIEANHYLSKDMDKALKDATVSEKSELGKKILNQLQENLKIADEEMIPICQDTGMAVIFLEVGQDVHFEGMAVEDAVNEGVRQGYVEGFLRKSVVGDPIIRENTKDNTPAVIHYSIVPGDKVEIGEGHVQKANVIFKELLPMLEEASEKSETGKVVITVCGGSGVGKSEIASLLSFYLKEAGIGSYTLSGDNYPHRIPVYNDAERLHTFRESALKGMVKEGTFTAERFEVIHEFQKNGDDANPKHTEEYDWYESYLRNGKEGLKGYLGTNNEIGFDEVEEIVKEFKAGTDEIWLKRMGREDTELWYEKVDFSKIQVLVIEWTHGNSDNYKGVDIPVLLNSTPQETLAHRRARNRDGATDSPFTMMVLELEQAMLEHQAPKAKIIISKSGELLSYEEYCKQMEEGR